MEHSETPNIVFFKTTALLHYLALPAYLLSQNLQRRNIFTFLKINDNNPKDLAHFYLFLIIVRHPKVVTLITVLSQKASQRYKRCKENDAQPSQNLQKHESILPSKSTKVKMRD
jgi:hypothetical protein